MTTGERNDKIVSSEEIKWITVNHVHIPVMPGKTKKEAVDNFVRILKESEDSKKKSTKRLIEELSQWSEMDEAVQTRKREANNKRKTISRDHYSRLKTMWSDYNRGACKPVEKGGVKYFNVDTTVYYTRGDYPDFYVSKKRTFGSHDLAVKFLEEIRNGK